MSFIPVFGGTPLAPSNQNYSPLVFSADVTLTWALESQNGSGSPVASHMDLFPSTAGLSVSLPNAEQGSNGFAILFTNNGADAVTIKDYDGNTVASVGSGESWYVYLEDNSTTAGTWATFQFGAGVSTANAASLIGAGIKAIGATLNQKVSVSPQAANYAVADSDRAKLLMWTGGNGTFTFPDPATLGADWFVLVRNSGSGSLNNTPSAGLIDGGASLLLGDGESAIIITDGSNYYTVGLGQAANSAFDYIGIDVSGTGDYVLAGVYLNRISYGLTGTLTGARNFVVPATVQQYWIQNNTSGAFDLTVKTAAGTGVIVAQGSSAILFCDGTNVINASDSAGITLPVSVVQGGTGATDAATARSNLGVINGETATIKGTDQTFSGTGYVDVAGAVAALTAGTWMIRFSARASLDSGGPGAINIRVNYSGTATDGAVVITGRNASNNLAGSGAFPADLGAGGTSMSIGTGGRQGIQVWGHVVVSDAGNFTIQVASVSADGLTYRILAGAVMSAVKVA